MFKTHLALAVLCLGACICSQLDMRPTYTNKQASDCFSQKGISTCNAIIKSCTDEPQCKAELSNYQSCSFGTSETEIFNGNCFKKWRQSASLTKQMIDCLADTCNLEYNSVISVNNLFKCTQQTVVNNFLQCDEDCGKQLNKIREKFGKSPIEQLFNEDIDNEAAQKIVSLIKKNCVESQYIEETPQVQTSEQNTEESVEQTIKEDGPINAEQGEPTKEEAEEQL